MLPLSGRGFLSREIAATVPNTDRQNTGGKLPPGKGQRFCAGRADDKLIVSCVDPDLSGRTDCLLLFDESFPGLCEPAGFGITESAVYRPDSGRQNGSRFMRTDPDEVAQHLEVQRKIQRCIRFEHISGDFKREARRCPSDISPEKHGGDDPVGKLHDRIGDGIKAAVGG